MAKKLKWNLILMSLLYLALGIFLLMVPGTALNVVCYALGGVVLACAAVQLVRYFVVERGVFQSQLTLISGLVCLALGAFLIIRSDVVVRVLPIVFGLFVIFDSLGRIQNALELRRCEYPSWKIFLLLAVLSVVLGIVMVVDPFGTMETLVMAIGLILILEGALNLLSALYTMLAVRRFIKLHPETQSMLEAITGQDLNGDGVIAPDVSHDFTEPFNQPIAYAQKVGELTNMLGAGHIMVQRYGDILDGKRTWAKELAQSNVKPTLKDAVAGDITAAMPYRAMTNIIEFIKMLDMVVPGFAANETLLYSPELKFYSNKVKMDSNLDTNIKGLHCLGDSSGWTRGLMMASVMGVLMGRKLAEKEGC